MPQPNTFLLLVILSFFQESTTASLSSSSFQIDTSESELREKRSSSISYLNETHTHSL